MDPKVAGSCPTCAVYCSFIMARQVNYVCSDFRKHLLQKERKFTANRELHLTA
jgi:hypothetical protein